VEKACSPKIAIRDTFQRKQVEKTLLVPYYKGIPKPNETVYEEEQEGISSYSGTQAVSEGIMMLHYHS